MLVNLSPKNRQSLLRQSFQDQRRDFDQKPIGLRNIGNTCFLNSIIQFLYAVEELRNSLISIYRDQSSMKEAKFPKLLGKLFFYIRQKCEDSTKMDEILRLMVLRLEGVNSQYCKYRQEDALQTLLNVLIEVESKHPDLARIFDVEYQVRCQCAELRIKERVLAYAPNQCVTCRSALLRTLVNKPKYIIYINASNKYKQQLQVLQIKTEQIAKQQLSSQILKYRLKSQIGYYGSGSVGHYVANRLDGNKWYRFNDSTVYQIQRNYFSEKKLLLFYQQVNQENYFELMQEVQRNIQQIQALLQKNNQLRLQIQSQNAKPRIQNPIFFSQIRKLQEVFHNRIQFKKIYQFKLKLEGTKDYSLYTKLIDVNGNYIGLYIFYNELRFDNNSKEIFQKSVKDIIENHPQNQLQILGKYLQQVIQWRFSKLHVLGAGSFRRYQIKNNFQLSPDLVYNVETNTIETSNLIQY